MSLLSKLEQLTQNKKAKEQKRVQENAAQKYEALQERLKLATVKRDKIKALQERLLQSHQKSQDRIVKFKESKKDLQGKYQEYEELLREEGVDSFEEMLETEADQPEVIEHRNAGRRKSNKLEDPEGGSQKVFEEWLAVKEEIKLELPDLDLNFSAKINEEHDMSNRDLAFQELANYLEILDKEILSLETEKDKAYLLTEQGKKEYFNSNVSFERSDLTDFSDEQKKKRQEAIEVFGEEEAKEQYEEVLYKKNVSDAWPEEERAGRGELIEVYPDWEKLSKMDYSQVFQKLNEVNRSYAEAVKNLAKIIGENDNLEAEISHYFGRLNDNQEYRNMDDNYRWASTLINQRIALSDIGMPSLNDFGKLERTINTHYDFASRNTHDLKIKINLDSLNFTPEFLQANLENYQKAFNYFKDISSKEDIKRELPGVNKSKDKGLGGEDVRKKIGIIEEKDFSERVYLKKHQHLFLGSFNSAPQSSLGTAERYYNEWEEKKKKLKDLSGATIDLCWLKADKDSLISENRDFLNERKNKEKSIEFIKENLFGLGSSFEHTAFFQDPLTYNGSTFKNERLYSKMRDKDDDYESLRKELDQYLKEEGGRIDQEIKDLEAKWLVAGKATKLEKLRTNKRSLNDIGFRTGTQSLSQKLTDEQRSKITDIMKRRDQCWQERYSVEAELDNFKGHLKSIPLSLLKNLIEFDDKVMTGAEIKEALESKINSLSFELENISEEEKNVLEKLDSIAKDLDAAEAKYRQVKEDLKKLKK